MVTTATPPKSSSEKRTLTGVIVGAGHIAKQHLAAVAESKHGEIAAVCDLSPATAQATADRHSIDRWFTDYTQMLDHVRPDIVHIATPPGSHAALVDQALKSGCHVIVEKPATPNKQKTIDAASLATANNLHLVEDFNYVFNPEVRQLFDRINAGVFGHVRHVDITLCLDIGDIKGGAASNQSSGCLSRGVVGDFLPHFASLAYFLAGKPNGVTTLWPSETTFRALADAERATVNLAFCPNAQPNAFWLRVYGSQQQMSLNLFEPHYTLRSLHNGPTPLIPLRNGISDAKRSWNSAWKGLSRKLAGGPAAYEGLWHLIQQTYASIAAGQTPPVTTNDVVAVAEYVDQLASPENAR